VTGTSFDPFVATPRPKSKTEEVCVFDTRVVAGRGGGPDKTILNSPRFLAGSGYRMLCGYLHPPGDQGFAEIERKASKYQAPLISIPDRGPWDWRVLKELLAVCKREKVAIWHGHDYKTNALGLILKKIWPMRLVTTVHGWVHHTSRTPLYYKIDRMCLPRYERVISVSEDLVEECRKAGVKPEKNLLLENAIDTDEYSRSLLPAVAKAKLGLPADGLLIGACGRLENEKAFDLLIRSVKTVRDRGQNVRLVILGEGGDRRRLEGVIADCGLKAIVLLPGWQSDVIRWYEAMDLFALSSLREGLPNVLLESMAMGVPTIATRIAGIPKLLEHEVNGLLVPAGDQDALTSALLRLTVDAELRDELKRAARRTIETRYSFPVRMTKLARIYDDLLQATPGRHPRGRVED
jgi:glycosyltransferase involved in cell wall biosynthesis